MLVQVVMVLLDLLRSLADNSLLKLSLLCIRSVLVKGYYRDLCRPGHRVLHDHNFLLDRIHLIFLEFNTVTESLF